MDFDQLANSTRATITLSDAANVLDADPRTVQRGIEEGTIPAIKIGRRTMVLRVPFLQMLTGENLPDSR